MEFGIDCGGWKVSVRYRVMSGRRGSQEEPCVDGTVDHGYTKVTSSRHWRSVDVTPATIMSGGAADPGEAACRYGRCSAR